MNFQPTSIQGAMLVELDPHADKRGVFVEGFVKSRMQEKGVFFDVRMLNLSRSEEAGTVRGLHWQKRPYEQGKMVFSAAGDIFDVIVDVRPRSPTFGKIFHVELVPQKNALYVPPGLAHGWQAMTAGATLLYLVDAPYKPELECGIRPIDPGLDISWPLMPTNVNPRDMKWPTMNELVRKQAEREAVSSGDVCLCIRNFDGRCESCVARMSENITTMISIISESKKKIQEAVSPTSDICDVCSRQDADYMLSKTSRDMFHFTDDNQELQEIFLGLIASFKGQFKEVSSWPLLDRTLQELRREMESSKGMEEEDLA